MTTKLATVAKATLIKADQYRLNRTIQIDGAQDPTDHADYLNSRESHWEIVESNLVGWSDYTNIVRDDDGNYYLAEVQEQ